MGCGVFCIRGLGAPYLVSEADGLFCIICAGKATVNSMYGTRVAVLAGDFLFAQSSWFLANLDNLEVRLYANLHSEVYSGFTRRLGLKAYLASN